MQNLKYRWTAVLKDGNKIEQYPSGNTETLFREVLDNAANLKEFYIQHISMPLRVTVDLVEGILFVNDMIQNIDSNITKKYNIRLIYFRRHTVKLTEGLDSDHSIKYFIGYQYTGEKSENHKILVQLDGLGNLVVGE